MLILLAGVRRERENEGAAWSGQCNAGASAKETKQHHFAISLMMIYLASRNVCRRNPKRSNLHRNFRTM